MRRRLAGIHQCQSADLSRQGDDPVDRVDDAEHVRHVREGHDPRPCADDLGSRVEVERAVVVHSDVAQQRSGAGRELLPRNEVRVVLALGHDDLVAVAAHVYVIGAKACGGADGAGKAANDVAEVCLITQRLCLRDLRSKRTRSVCTSNHHPTGLGVSH